jgi:Saccharopine dehydrogenase NADP binding domain
MARPCVLVLGGTGVFGHRIAANLAKRPELDLVIAARDGAAAAALVRTLGAGRTASLAVDIGKADAVPRLLAAKPTVIVDTVGPFQTRNLALPRRCAERGIHYVDIADARSRVADIASLDAAARLEHAAIVSGASTVPAITTAIVDELAPNPREVVSIDVGITPGHRAKWGLATATAVLGYCGQRIPPVCGSADTYGWGDLTSHLYPAPVGERWLSNVDTPERALWRARYPALEDAMIRAGLGIGVFHFGLSALSYGVRLGILPSLARFAKPLLKLADVFEALSTDSGALHVRVMTRDAHARTTSREAVLVAEHGDGPQVPAAPAALVVKKLLGLPGYAPLEKRGAFPCIGILTREEILGELKDFSIRYIAPR